MVIFQLVMLVFPGVLAIKRSIRLNVLLTQPPPAPSLDPDLYGFAGLHPAEILNIKHLIYTMYRYTYVYIYMYLIFCIMYMFVMTTFYMLHLVSRETNTNKQQVLDDLFVGFKGFKLQNSPPSGGPLTLC